MSRIAKQAAAPEAGGGASGLGGLVDAACAATEAARGLEALARIDSEEALGDVAQRARSWEIRLAAAQRVTDSEVLARIVEATRHRDKRVYQHCVDLLRARRRTLAHATRAAELVAAFRSLLATEPDRGRLPVERFEALETELGRLRQEGEVPPDCLEVAAVARERANAEALALRQLGSDAAEAEALCAQLAAHARPADVAVFRARLNALAARPSGRAAWLADHPTANALAHSIEKAHALLAALASEPDAIEACNRFIESKAAAPGEGGGTAAVDLALLEAEWDALPKPKDASALGLLQARWTRTRESLAARRLAQAQRSLPAPREASALGAEEREALRRLLERLARELQAGQLADAQETERQIGTLAGARALPEGLARRLRRDRAQLGRMRDWARWGNDQAREQLILSAEALAREKPDVEALGTAVPALRAEWKRLDSAGPASKSQWERFDALLTKAFQPVVEFRARRAAEEKAAAEAKAAIMSEFEAWLASIDWAQADWRALEARRRETTRRWRALAFAGFREERKLRKRLERLFKALQERLGAARQEESALRETLIREAEALREAPGVGDSINSVVALQARWKASAGRVQLARQDEQALWQRFRSACDAVFARREAQRAERDAERARQVQERQVLFERFESALASSDAGAVARAQAEFKKAWASAQRNSGDRNDPLGSRARELLRRAERRIDTLRLEAKRGRYETLAGRAALIERLETAACGGSVPESLASQVEQDWAKLPPLAPADEKAMRARLAAAPKANGAGLERGLVERGSLLLDLELALGLPSPASASGARRERQLLRLRERFRPGDTPAADPEALLLRWYATPARSDPEQEARLAAIVETLVRKVR